MLGLDIFFPTILVLCKQADCEMQTASDDLTTWHNSADIQTMMAKVPTQITLS